MKLRSENIELQSLDIRKLSLNLILMAGHAQNFRIIDEGRRIAKKTNRKEYEIYANPDGLQEIIPAVEKTSQDDQEISDMGKNVMLM